MTLGEGVAFRGGPTVLKIVMIMLCCTAYEIVKLCSKIDGADLCGACKRSISDGQIGQADGSDELAVLGKSLDSVGCSLSLDSLTET